MIDERFNSNELKNAGRDSGTADSLVHALRVAIAEECVPDLRAAGEKVAVRLRTLGHDVRAIGFEEYDGAFGITYVDTSAGIERERHLLRFNLDLVVSAGYPGYKPTAT